ncbi:TetR/AcrR family transcriptional regulator [Nocardia brasiliensis]|uniref:TetR/AcrR family transcriptional regulator n=1 Tax=Nocardia brasiliensis TaxID=37326 RepID=UPI0024558564|nr:helix-turn-helix domain-containing protein [Nocardia brasiliensis]
MTTSTRPPRRSQQQRRATTVTKLIAATITSLSECGYQGTSVREICTRADLSPGAMFRQFTDRRELLVATVADIVEHELTTFRVLIASLGSATGVLPRNSGKLRAGHSATRITALHEVLIAARTDSELSAALGPVMRGFYTTLLADEECADVLGRFPEPVREAVILTILDTFAGRAALGSTAYTRAEVDKAVLDVTYGMLRAYLHTAAA